MDYIYIYIARPVVVLAFAIFCLRSLRVRLSPKLQMCETLQRKGFGLCFSCGISIIAISASAQFYLILVILIFPHLNLANFRKWSWGDCPLANFRKQDARALFLNRFFFIVHPHTGLGR